MRKKIDAPKAWAWEIPTEIDGTEYRLCSWAEASHPRLRFSPPTDDGRIVRVRIIREADYQRFLRKAVKK